jgi:hypothetical protein
MASQAPENEIGHGNTGLIPWSAFTDVTETVPELTWPNSINTYTAMRTDAQIASLLLAFTLPIRRYRWYIDPNGTRDEVAEDVANDFNLPIEGQDQKPATRRRDRFSHDRHLFHALLMLTWGSMYFEQVYRFDEASKRFRLRKLAPRMPGSISEIQVARDGGLEYIRQYPSGQSGITARTSLISLQSPQIPVDRLVAYVNDQEAGNWYGISYLRSLFRHWVRKDRLLRVDAINAERNGAGVPLAYAPPNATKDQITALSNLARSYRAGESAGGALPNGAELRFRGVEGTLPDVLASLRYDDEQMAARFCAQFSKLGTTQTGSYALGQTLVDFFALAQEAVAKQYAETTNEHVIEDLVDVNYGIDESAPLIKFETETDKRYSVADMKALIDAGALTTDPELEAYIRSEGDLPKKSEEDQQDEGDDKITPIRPAARSRIKSKTTTEPQAAMTVGGRTLRRNPLPHEVKASVDWDAMEQAWVTQQASLVDDWKTQVKNAHVDALAEAIQAAETLDQLAALEAPILGEELLGDAMFALAEEAGTQAVAEAAAQGVELDPFDSELVADEIAVRASAQSTVMARSISQAASQKAITVAGSGLAMEEVAGRVREHLEGLSDSYLQDQLGGVLMQVAERLNEAALRDQTGTNAA